MMRSIGPKPLVSQCKIDIRGYHGTHKRRRLRHLGDSFFNDKVCISIEIQLTYVLRDPMYIKSALESHVH